MVGSSSVLITGASTGIGAACCIEMASRGWRVYAGVRSMEAGEAMAAEWANVVPVRLDVTDEGTIGAAAEKLGRELGEAGLSGLVNNAGVAVTGPVELTSIEDWRRQLEVNVVGLAAVTRAMLPMLRRARGRIVNISSVSGRVAAPYLAPYAASKFAVEAISDALRIELHPWGIQVALIEPGPVATPIWGKARAMAKAQMNDWPAEAKSLYADYFAISGAMVDESERHAVSVEKVAARVGHALTSRRARVRYLMGSSSWVVRLRPFIPDRVWDWLVRRMIPGR